jgi:hypothetical protein
LSSSSIKRAKAEKGMRTVSKMKVARIYLEAAPPFFMWTSMVSEKSPGSSS